MAITNIPRSFAVGELKHSMTLHAPAGTDAVTAVDVDTNVPIKITVVPLQFQRQERLDLGGPQTQTLYTLACRYREDVKAAYVWVEQCCTQRTFQILAIIPSDRKDALDMTCVTNG